MNDRQRCVHRRFVDHDDIDFVTESNTLHTGLRGSFRHKDFCQRIQSAAARSRLKKRRWIKRRGVGVRKELGRGVLGLDVRLQGDIAFSRLKKRRWNKRLGFGIHLGLGRGALGLDVRLEGGLARGRLNRRWMKRLGVGIQLGLGLDVRLCRLDGRLACGRLRKHRSAGLSKDLPLLPQDATVIGPRSHGGFGSGAAPMTRDIELVQVPRSRASWPDQPLRRSRR